jgi:glycosyltransferase involved in cell wall biosynthesis
MPAETPLNRGRVLLAVPAYNEALTLGGVIEQLRSAQLDVDVLVVNDGSRDATEVVATAHGVLLLNHLCNLGYGRATQTAIRFAERAGYDVLVTYDADGQHRPEDVRALLDAFGAMGCDLLIGSRFMPGAPGFNAPWSRRLGMRLFSRVVWIATGARIHDTSSGLRVIRRSVFNLLTRRLFVDFHAEAIVYLLGCGYAVKEHPITVEERRHGTSMYGVSSVVKYPLKTLLLVIIGLLEARMVRRKVDDTA